MQEHVSYGIDKMAQDALIMAPQPEEQQIIPLSASSMPHHIIYPRSAEMSVYVLIEHVNT